MCLKKLHVVLCCQLLSFFFGNLRLSWNDIELSHCQATAHVLSCPPCDFRSSRLCCQPVPLQGQVVGSSNTKYSSGLSEAAWQGHAFVHLHRHAGPAAVTSSRCARKWPGKVTSL